MSDVVIITGSGGLIGSCAANYYLKLGYKVVGIDNNSREVFFGPEASVIPSILELKDNKNYEHHYADIANYDQIKVPFNKYGKNVYAVIHSAAQPSHDWALKDIERDFLSNAYGTLNVGKAFRNFCSDSVLIHCSTNKVFGDAPNKLNFIETDTRYDFADEKYKNGIDETMTIDNSVHSFFGVSKLYADVFVQELGKNLGLKTGVFRGGCLTSVRSGAHKSVELHGFLSYIVKCAKEGRHYKVFGNGKRVRDQLHSEDVLGMFNEFIKNPKQGEVYNMGGEKENSISILETINKLREDFDLTLKYELLIGKERTGDHVCYYTDMTKFRKDFPEWKKLYSLDRIFNELNI